MKAALKDAKKYSTISLFSGIGGLDVGLRRSGFVPVFCSEIDPNAFATLKAHLNSKKIYPDMRGDINDVDPKKLKRQLGLAVGELDLLAGGPPCQPFSLIGKRDCLNDSRGMLLYKMVDFAAVFKPKVVLIEQVKGLLSAPCEKGIRSGAFDQLVKKLSRLGYTVTHSVLLAADYGVPQLRERLIIVASQRGSFEFPLPRRSAYKTVADAIADLPAPVIVGQPEAIANHADVTPARDRARIKGVPEGECLAKQHHLPKSQRMNLTNKDTTKFRRMAWDKPALTLRGGEAFYHPVADRYLTPREYLRLHGFADDFVLHGPIRGRCGTVRELDQHRLVANAVPPRLAEVIGHEIVRQFLESELLCSRAA